MNSVMWCCAGEEASRSDDEDNDNVRKAKRQSVQSIPDDSYESIDVSYGFKVRYSIRCVSV